MSGVTLTFIKCGQTLIWDALSAHTHTHTHTNTHTHTHKTVKNEETGQTGRSRRGLGVDRVIWDSEIESII